MQTLQQISECADLNEKERGVLISCTVIDRHNNNKPTSRFLLVFNMLTMPQQQIQLLPFPYDRDTLFRKYLSLLFVWSSKTRHFSIVKLHFITDSANHNNYRKKKGINSHTRVKMSMIVIPLDQFINYR